MFHFSFNFHFPSLQRQAKRYGFRYRKESRCRIIYDFSFQKSHFKSSLWFGCIKTTQNNSSTFLGTRKNAHSSSGFRARASSLPPEENSRKELSHGVENTTPGWSTMRKIEHCSSESFCFKPPPPKPRRHARPRSHGPGFTGWMQAPPFVSRRDLVGVHSG